MGFFSHVDGHRLWTGRHVRHTLAALERANSRASIRFFVFVLLHLNFSLFPVVISRYTLSLILFFLFARRRRRRRCRRHRLDGVRDQRHVRFFTRTPVLRAHPRNGTPRRATPFLPTDDAPNFTVLRGRPAGT